MVLLIGVDMPKAARLIRVMVIDQTRHKVVQELLERAEVLLDEVGGLGLLDFCMDFIVSLG